MKSSLELTRREKEQPRRHQAGCAGERVVCAALSTLAYDGVQHLDDRQYREGGRPEVNIDHIVVAPSGVWVVDAKNWGGRVEVRHQALFQDGQPVDHRTIALNHARVRVDEYLAMSKAPSVSAHAVVCFTKEHRGMPRMVGRTHLTDPAGLQRLIGDGPRVLTTEQMTDVLDVLTWAFPAYDVDPTDAAQAVGLLFPDLETRHAGMEQALARPVEDWMVWLHPEQARHVRRTFNGPARVRGAAGTGKTTVALHRLAHLAATRPGRFLVTSFVKTLPQVLATSYARLSPDTVDRVEFRHVHDVAATLLREHGVAAKAWSQEADRAFTAAWNEVPELHGRVLHKDYFAEEVRRVVKGRGLRFLDEYLAIDRVGRRAPLAPDTRRAVWRLVELYDAHLARRGIVDFQDVPRMARDLVRQRRVAPPYAAVVVDEVQDLTQVELELLHELCGRDKPDGLLLIGDGQQAIYTGGFRLSDAGIGVAGRSVSLRVNYRNTVEVLARARAIVLGDEFEDLGDAPEAGDRDVEVVRHGAQPTEGTFSDDASQVHALLWDLQSLLSTRQDPESIAVLVQTTYQVKEWLAHLHAAGVEAVSLEEGGDGVRVGTWHRAKGLEFAHVFLPDWDFRTRHLLSLEDEERLEAEQLRRRQLFVAMTRARDTLWMGRVA